MLLVPPSHWQQGGAGVLAAGSEGDARRLSVCYLDEVLEAGCFINDRRLVWLVVLEVRGLGA